MATKIASKFEVDLTSIFDETDDNKEPTWQPKLSQNGAKVATRSVKDEKGGKCPKCCTVDKNLVFEGLGAAPGDGNLRKKPYPNRS